MENKKAQPWQQAIGRCITPPMQCISSPQFVAPASTRHRLADKNEFVSPEFKGFLQAGVASTLTPRAGPSDERPRRKSKPAPPRTKLNAKENESINALTSLMKDCEAKEEALRLAKEAAEEQLAVVPPVNPLVTVMQQQHPFIKFLLRAFFCVPEPVLSEAPPPLTASVA